MTDDQKPRDPAAEKLEDAHNAAEPAKTDKSADRANVTPVDQGCGVAEKDKKF